MDKDALWKIATILIGLITSVTLTISGWALYEVVSHGRILSGIGSSRCTAEDCSRIRESISELQGRLTELSKGDPKAPDWLVNQIRDDKLRTSQDVAELKRRVEALEAKRK